MTLFLGPNLENQLSRQDCKPLFLVEINPPGVSLRYTNTMNHRLDNINGAIVSSVSPVSSEIDVVTREFARGSYTIVLNESQYLRTFMKDVSFHNLDLTIKFGTSESQEAEMVVLDQTLITDFFVDSASIVIKCRPKFWYLLESKTFYGHFINRHPLEIALEVLETAGVPVSSYNANSFLWSNYDDFLHWNMSATFFESWWRGSYDYKYENPYNPGQGSLNQLSESVSWWKQNSFYESVPSVEVIQNISRMLNGHLVPDSFGVYGFSQIDLNQTETAKTLTGNDIMSFQHRSSTDNAYTGVRIIYGRRDDGTEMSFTVRDSNSTSDFNRYADSNGLSERILTFNVGELNSPVIVGKDFRAVPDPAFMLLHGAPFAGFAQNRWPPRQPGDPIPLAPDYVGSQSWPLYVLLMGEAGQRWEFAENGIDIVDRSSTVDEIMCFATSLPYGGAFSNYNYSRVFTENDGTRVFYPTGAIAVSLNEAAPNGGRFQFQETIPTNPIVWQPGTRAYDVTIPVYIAQKILQRVRYGTPIIECMLTLRHMDLQVGDLVTVEHDQVCFYGVDGSDAGVAWEVIGTELRALDDTPGVKVTLAYMNGTSLIDPPTFPPLVADGLGETPRLDVVFTATVGDNIITTNLDDVTNSAGERLIRG